jgi:hypothetical protein
MGLGCHFVDDYARWLLQAEWAPRGDHVHFVPAFGEPCGQLRSDCAAAAKLCVGYQSDAKARRVGVAAHGATSIS